MFGSKNYIEDRNKFFKENILLEQDFVKDSTQTIEDLVTTAVSKLGENIVISSAAGQIGHLVGQIAKILGLNVIGKISYDFFSN